MSSAQPPPPSLPAAGIEDCWNRIGVRGDRSCPKLAGHVHCRNCAVYAAAASRLLDTPLSAAYLAQSTSDLAQEKTEAEAGALAVLIFRLGTDLLALPAAALREIVPTRPIHALPHRRNGVVLGVANIRGSLPVCIALRPILDPGSAAEGDRGTASPAGARMLVMRQDGAGLVYPVDDVLGIARFRPQDLGPVPVTLAKAATACTKAVLSWQGKTVSLLDEHLLSSAVNRSLALATAI